MDVIIQKLEVWPCVPNRNRIVKVQKAHGKPEIGKTIANGGENLDLKLNDTVYHKVHNVSRITNTLMPKTYHSKYSVLFSL